MEKEKLVEIAIGAMKKAYTPYSHFKVGAALLCEDGTVYEGCNIENAAYSPTICAERVAFSSAVRDGFRKFKAIAIVGGTEGELDSFTYPCGVCRQVMREFCTGDFPLIFFDGKEYKVLSLDEIMPYSFTPADLLG